MRCLKCGSKSIIKKGKVKTRQKVKKVQRFKCKACGNQFTNRTENEIYRQKRPELNKSIQSLYVEGMPLRAIARHLGCSYNTVVRKFKKLSSLSQIENLRRREGVHSVIQLDELHTFIGKKSNRVYVAIAVGDNGQILGFKVSQPENRRRKFSEFLVEIKDNVTIDTIFFFDQDKMYPPEFNRVFPDNDYADINTARNVPKTGLLNQVDFVCALIRNRLGRANRKSWCFTRKLQRLEKNLSMLMATWNQRFV